MSDRTIRSAASGRVRGSSGAAGFVPENKKRASECPKTPKTAPVERREASKTPPERPKTPKTAPVERREGEKAPSGRLPELLAPAGSPRALEAAIEGGADAVYFGGVRNNARALAQNFTPDDIAAAVGLAHLYGVRMYQTVNTLVTDRELSGVLEDARVAYEAGVDALIVADLGAAAAIHARFPDLPLHASTQASGHGVESARQLARLGFCRMVCAREMSYDDLCRFTAASPIEAEVFVHGALCVCHSGQCLFSSMVGGRSGNRGECAQPCRLPYRVGGRERYPLSLKDLSLAGHIPELIAAGVASLKLEGRMKSPEYVLAVTRVFRRLLDERRAATPEEMSYLASIFSRDGFTDGYFTGRIGRDMLGVRREQDKSATRSLEPFAGLDRRLALDVRAEIKRDRPMLMTVTQGERQVCVTGEVPEAALRTPSEREAVLRSLTKFGGTPFCLGRAELTLDEGLAVSVSKLNALRRAALDAMREALCVAPTRCAAPSGGDTAAPSEVTVSDAPSGVRQCRRMARFARAAQITPLAREFFDVIYLPLHDYAPIADGVVLPAVIFDSELETVERQLARAAAAGAREALVGNLGHVEAARRAGLTVHGDLRLNVTSSRSVAALEALGIDDVIASPELTLPQLRDLGGSTAAVVYGRIPLMVLEKCVGRELGSCADCTAGRLRLTDRRGVSFPVLRERPHRSVIYNSLPTGMSDRAAELERAGITDRHFIFSVETPTEVDAVIRAYREGRAMSGQVRRL